jgi:hypothetical protein
MAEVQISRRDIDSLADKLARLEPELPAPERALLLFMLGVAADSIGRPDAGENAGALVSRANDQSVPVVVALTASVPSIEEEFTKAFTPAAARKVALLRGSVGPSPVD